jgi:hypothetical protein
LVTNFIDGFASNMAGTVNLSISLDATEHQKTSTFKLEGQYLTLPAYTGKDDISGKIDL